MSAIPLFSIIIPTFNSEATISRALESVLGQTFDTYEILVMDGLSLDKTISIVESYRLENPNIRLYSEGDEGIYDAMNKGLERCKGEWLYFIGSDDYLFDNDVLQNVFSHIKNTSYDVIYGNVHYAARNCLYDGEFTYTKLTQRNICHQAIFVKKEVFKKIGNFDGTYKTVADWHHNIRWFYNTDIQHQFIDVTIAEYSDGGYSSQNRDQKFMDLKNEIFLKYGFFTLPLRDLIGMTTKIVKKHKKQNRYIPYLMFGCLLFCLKVKKAL